MQDSAAVYKNPFPSCVFLLGPNQQTLVFAKNDQWMESAAEPYFVVRNGDFVGLDEMR